jgi:hypothetical protein
MNVKPKQTTDSDVAKHRHHYVWRKYLEPWTNDNLIWPSIKLIIKRHPINISNLAVKTDFYRVRRLTKVDITFIRETGVNLSTNPRLRELNEGWIKFFLKPQNVKGFLQSIGMSEESEKIIEIAECNLEEAIYCTHEGYGNFFLPNLLEMKSDFLSDPDHFDKFATFICSQYMRTKKNKDRFIAVHKQNDDFKGVNFAASFAVLRHIFITNMAWSIIADRQNWKLQFLVSDGEEEFITTDQPIINCKSIDGVVPTDVAFYYPLSPKLAIMFSKSDQSPRTSKLYDYQVLDFNRKMVEMSHEMVFASSEEHLKKALAGIV